MGEDYCIEYDDEVCEQKDELVEDKSHLVKTTDSHRKGVGTTTIKRVLRITPL